MELSELEAEIWGWLARGRADRRSPLRHPAVATVDRHGAPTARTVVLRGVDAPSRTLEFHTDARSPKALQLAERPRVAWMFWDPRRRLQIRAGTRARVHIGDAVAQQAWTSTPDGSRAQYRTADAPGQPLPAGVGPTDVERGTQAHFAVVRCEVDRFDVLELGGDGHRRAEIRYEGGQARTCWLVP